MAKKEIDAKIKMMPTHNEETSGAVKSTSPPKKIVKKKPQKSVELYSVRTKNKSVPRPRLSAESTGREETKKKLVIPAYRKEGRSFKEDRTQIATENNKKGSPPKTPNSPDFPLHKVMMEVSQEPTGNSTKGQPGERGIDSIFCNLECFHGYICREDLPSLLKKFGDFLIRISVHMSNSEKGTKLKKKKSNKEAKDKNKEVEQAHSSMLLPVGKDGGCLPPNGVDRDYVISVYSKLKEKAQTKRNSPIRNIIIRKIDGQFALEGHKTFKTISDLFVHYKTNHGTVKEYEYQLLSPVGLSTWEFKHKEIELLDKKLGEGAFGEVRVGKVKLKDNGEKLLQIAVKMLKNAETVTRDQVQELLHEGRIMRYLDHKNVLRSYGIAVLHEPLYLMSELCSFGALREYLKENSKTVTLADRLMFCVGAARGVEYLHSQKMIHRDLAARNVLLTEDRTPKVSDFGLAKVTDRYEMKEACKIPVRYLAPETLETYVFTTKSDVFAFGMVMWEIYENGTQPHDGKNVQTIKDLVKKNQFLKLNNIAPAQLQKFVTEKVFVSDPENRCNMSAVVQHLERIEKEKLR